MDLTGSQENLKRFKRKLRVEVIPVSAVTGKGLEALAEHIWRTLNPGED
jgi:ribosome-interacting GTPase 1